MRTWLASPFLLTMACYAENMGMTGAPSMTDDYSSSPEDSSEFAETNPWTDSADDSVSTFSVDVDSASYSMARRAINDGALPEVDSVRVEEFVNYFRYDDPRPEGELPFAVSLEAVPSAFGHDADVHLLRIGIQAEEISEDDRDPVNLVFLLDVSGSMNSPDKLGLVVYAMKHLVDKLTPSDTLGIVVYAGSEGVVLPPTAVEDKSAILDALDALQAGGSTNGEAGIQLAYELAERAFRQDGVNRVVLCTDGDFNVGLTGNRLVEMVEDYRDRDIYLTTLGFGTGNYDDETMEQLADRGNGNYAYIDSPNEALRVLGDKLVSTLQVVAKDVKVQVEFNARSVDRWRLIGYENRILDDEDFADDDVDAGDIGAGHNVSALYELELTDTPAMANLAEVRIRYKEPTSDESSEHTWSIHGDKSQGAFTDASDSFRFSAAVTEFAEILRESPHSEGARFGEIIEILSEASPEAERDLSQAELIELVDAASALY
jgi:Ca-activated chloride channel family protein